jgi:regulator of nucleoside diphosphate kinase
MTKKLSSEKQLVLLDSDVVRLKRLLQDKASEGHQYCTALKEEMLKASIVPWPDLPANVVIMHSMVEIQDMEDKESVRYILVYPWEADVDSNKISILAPIGTAIIGYKQGDEIEWKVPGGIRRLQITSVVQPHDGESDGVINKS